MKRKILLIAISYLVGNIGGLYLNKNIILFLYFLLLIYMLLSKKNIYKFFVILILVVSCHIASIKSWEIQNINYTRAYLINGVVVGEEEGNGIKKYIAQICKCNDKSYQKYKVIIQTKENMKVGDRFTCSGKFADPDKTHNYNIFSYKRYLLSKKICGVFSVEKIKIKKCKLSISKKILFDIRAYIDKTLDTILPPKNSGLCKSIITGSKSDIDNEIVSDFSNSSLSHTIAVSGMHVMYVYSIIMFCTSLINKRKSYVIVIFCCIFFWGIVGEGESVNRAIIMIILSIIAKLFHRNSDSITNLSIAVLLSLIKNPFAIYSSGFLLSYMGTISIIVIYQKINLKQSNNKIVSFIKSQLILSISTNIVLCPIIAKLYNKVTLSFFVTSVISSILLTIIFPLILICLVLGTRLGIVSFIFSKLLYIFSEVLIRFSHCIANMKYLTYVVTSPKPINIIFYYLVIISICLYIYGSKADKKIVKKIVYLCLCLWLIICIMSYSISRFSMKMRIYFIDVGQGDATLIITKHNKKILIDGGGSEQSSNYIGEHILLPYLLDKGVRTIDYVIISHFDTDHVRRYIIFNGKSKNKKCNCFLLWSEYI